VLKWFGNKEKEAVKSYREFVKERKKDLDNITNPQYTGIVDVLIFLNNTPPCLSCGEFSLEEAYEFE